MRASSLLINGYPATRVGKMIRLGATGCAPSEVQTGVSEDNAPMCEACYPGITDYMGNTVVSCGVTDSDITAVTGANAGAKPIVKTAPIPSSMNNFGYIIAALAVFGVLLGARR